MNCETAAEWASAFLRGEIVDSIEMGGIGPGYEQAIQCAVVVLCQKCSHVRVTEKDTAYPQEFDTALHDADMSLGGLSGAQAGAAKWLAFRFMLEGPNRFMDRARVKDRDRCILVSKAWPSMPV